MGNDCEEHTGNMLWELDIRLNSAYTQGHLKATIHAFLTWREKPPSSLSRTHNKMDWTTSGTHLVPGYSLNAESSGKLVRRRKRPQPPACYTTDFVCTQSCFCLSFWVDPLGGGESRHLRESLPIWVFLWLGHSALSTTGSQVVTQPGKELWQLPLRVQTCLPASEGFTIRWNISNRLWGGKLQFSSSFSGLSVVFFTKPSLSLTSRQLPPCKHSCRRGF